MFRCSLLASIELQNGQEGLLGHLNPSDLLHSLLARFLLLEQLALAADIAAVELGGDVLSQRLHGVAGENPRARRGLNRNVEELTRDGLLKALHERPAGAICLV